MSRRPFLAGVLSLLVPGLGQIYSGKGERGAAILIAALIVGNLNAIWLTLFATASAGTRTFWGYTLPRMLHDLFAAWGLVFLMWQVVDAYRQAKQTVTSLGTVWVDDVTRSGAFEPVGTPPAHQRRGLDKSVVCEGPRRVN
jgi:TM2 domain-containing membrane protein YozV